MEKPLICEFWHESKFKRLISEYRGRPTYATCEVFAADFFIPLASWLVDRGIIKLPGQVDKFEAVNIAAVHCIKELDGYDLKRSGFNYYAKIARNAMLRHARNEMSYYNKHVPADYALYL